MRFFIIANGDTQEFLQWAEYGSDSLSAVQIESALQPGAAFTVKAWEVTDTALQDRIKAGDEISIQWSNGEITGINFTPEDSKRYVKITSDKGNIAADGADSCTITFEIFESDGITPAAIDTTVLIDVLSSAFGVIPYRVQITGGSAAVIFSTTTPGSWSFPADPQRYANFKISAQAVIKSYLG